MKETKVFLVCMWKNKLMNKVICPSWTSIFYMWKFCDFVLVPNSKIEALFTVSKWALIKASNYTNENGRN